MAQPAWRSPEDRAARFTAYGWHVQEVDDGHDLQALEQALLNAQDESLRPFDRSWSGPIWGYAAPA